MNPMTILPNSFERIETIESLLHETEMAGENKEDTTPLLVSQRHQNMNRFVIGAACGLLWLGGPLEFGLEVKRASHQDMSVLRQVEQASLSFDEIEQEIQSLSETTTRAWQHLIDGDEIQEEIELISEYMSKMGNIYASRKRNFTM